MRWALFFLILIGLELSAQIPELSADSLNPVASDSLMVIGNIHLSGNRITRDKIILRELEFKPGDTLTPSEVEQLITYSRQNLINRSIFNFVTISPIKNKGKMDFQISVTERWYIWPIPILNTANRNLNSWWESRDLGQLNYGVDLRVENFRGRLEILNILIQFGFDQKLEARWTIPYLTKRQYLGLGITGGMQWNREVIFATSENKPEFYEPSSGFAREYGYGILDVTLRPQFNFLHTLSIGYHHNRFNDSLWILNPHYAPHQEISEYFTFSYLYKQDYRDYKPYPLTGYYFDIGLKRTGPGINGNDIGFWSFSVTLDQYLNIYKRWYFAYSIIGWLADKSEIPYFLTPAFGYLGMEIRGYELYLINGQNFGLFKSNVKFEIIPKTVKRIPGIKTEKFGKIFYALYANLFFDMGFASDKLYAADNPLSNQLLWGYGLGLDFVTYYDLVIRFEFALNKQGDYGFYINLVAPI
jgi:outer membrane protein assembly factor BamA